ncbi:MAG TPA: hypothetical protein VK993_05470 [Chthoniobacterales bacterium]|nr:hypothetical protein [Chthoniobacterales bacterium]
MTKAAHSDARRAFNLGTNVCPNDVTVIDVDVFAVRYANAAGAGRIVLLTTHGPAPNTKCRWKL